MEVNNYKYQLFNNYIKHIYKFQLTKILNFIDIFGLIIIVFPEKDGFLTPKRLLLLNIFVLIYIIIAVFIGKQYHYITKPINTFIEHTYHINAIAINNNETMLSSCGGETILWDAQNRNVISRIPSDGWVGNIKFSYDNKYLVILNGKKGKVSLFSLQDFSVFEIPDVILGKSRGLAAYNDIVMVSSANGIVTVLDIQNKLLQKQYKVSEYEIRKIVATDNGKIACGDNNGAVYYSDHFLQEEFSPIFRLPKNELIRDVVFSPNEKILGFTDSGGYLTLFDLDSKISRSVKAHNGHAICLAFSPAGNIVATGGQDERIRLWNVKGKEPELLFEIRGHTDDITDLEFSKANILWSASRDAKVMSWDLRGID